MYDYKKYIINFGGQIILRIRNQEDLQEFNKYKENVINDISNYVRTENINSIEIRYNEFIDEKLVDAICENNNINTINISYKSNYPQELLKKLNQKELCLCYELDINDPFYFDKSVTSFTEYPLNFNMNVDNQEIIIDRILQPEELEILKKLFMLYPQKNVEIEFETTEQFNEIINIIKSDSISLAVNDKVNFENITFANALGNVKFIKKAKSLNSFDVELSYDQISKKEQFLNEIVNSIKGLNLSPFENYIYLYNIVKKIKPYKECESNHLEAREIDLVLFNDYIVCEGYCNLLEELINRLKDPNLICAKYGLSYKVQGENKIVGHARNIININDPNYNINGVFVSDPTWDSVNSAKSDRIKNIFPETESQFIGETDWYSHVVMTGNEINTENGVEIMDELLDTISISGDSNSLVKMNKTAYSKMKNKEENIKMLENVPYDSIKECVYKIYQKVYGTNFEEYLDKIFSDNELMNTILYGEERNIVR